MGFNSIFRQPLVLCSSGQLNSAQSVNYSAAPLPRMPQPAPAEASAAACAATLAAASAAAASGLPAAPSMSGGSSSNSSSPSRPSPFATKGGQAVMRSSIQEFTAGDGALPHTPFYAVTSLPPGCLPQREQQLHRPAPARAGTSAAAAAAATTHAALQWQNSGAMQSWSSLPVAGLRTCSSLQQLSLQMSGAPPTPQDLMDLSALPHLSHLSFRQVEDPPAGACAAAGQVAAAAGAGAGAGPAASAAFTARAGEAAAAGLAPMAMRSVGSLGVGEAAGGASMLIDEQWGSDDEDEEQQQQHSSSSSSSEMQADDQYQDAEDAMGEGGYADDTVFPVDQGAALASAAVAAAAAAAQPLQEHAAAAAAAAGPALFGLSAPPGAGTACISCSVITPQHVEALARLPQLSSLELHPKQGAWDQQQVLRCCS
ncbi:hypothetical protein COO60DRAFT_1011386 [Scenedesmus sp. NREL 46B-D3]|nr:hypothetical protein COO60DRAFT_1011386 [Scenedesmus sp. NREL 46B-D3]